MSFEVLVVVCESYRELGLGYDVGGAADALAEIRHEVQARRAKVRLLEGKVTERRLERALRALGKRQGPGTWPALVLLGHEVRGELAVENTALRRPGKRMRTFSDARIAALIGGVPTSEGDIRVGERKVPVLRVLPESVNAARERYVYRIPDFAKKFYEKLKVRQADVGHNTYWTKENGAWRVREPSETLAVGDKARIRLKSLPEPGNDIGILELTLQDGYRQEDWYFWAGTWPDGDFKLQLVGPYEDWVGLGQALANRTPVKTLAWKGFQATRTAEPTSIQEGFYFSPSPSPDDAYIFAETTRINTFRFVTRWYSMTGQGFVLTTMKPEFWAFSRGPRPLGQPYAEQS